jgi:hypothetical protein
MAEGRGRWRRRSLVIATAIGVAGISFDVGLATHNVLAGVGAGAVFAAFSVSLAVFSRRGAETRAPFRSSAPLEVDALLDFSCLPGDWPVIAPETMGALVGHRLGCMNVVLAVSDGDLVIERQKVALTGKIPFSAYVPLTAIRKIRVGKPLLSFIGSSLTFDLASGDELRVDLRLGSDSAERVAGAFRDATRSAAGDASSRICGIEVTSPRPPIRTPPSRAALLMMAFLPPWAFAMAGARNGPFAAVALTGGLFVALGLMMVRPKSMPVILAWIMGIAGGAFVLDAVRVGQPVRLVGAASCALIVASMVKYARRRGKVPQR